MSGTLARRKADFARQLVAAAAVHGGKVKERTNGVYLFAAEWHVKFPRCHYINVYLDNEGRGFALYALQPQRFGKTILHNVPLKRPEQIAAFFKDIAEGRQRPQRQMAPGCAVVSIPFLALLAVVVGVAGPDFLIRFSSGNNLVAPMSLTENPLRLPSAPGEFKR